MHLFDHSRALPHENLALDEALIAGAESGETGEVLRFWESPVPFVVLGAGGAVVQEAHGDACRREGVPILRRCSGGGTVLQGPGCLNYALLLDRDKRAEYSTIENTNRVVLAGVADALAACGVPAQLDGTSDLTVDGFKFSGNAQRRRKRWILFHGTILYAFELDQIARYLREPRKQPEYRADRQHGKFVRNVPLEPASFKAALAHAFNAREPLLHWPEAHMHRLVAEKYGRPDWNTSF